jgi:hypothetical protein
MNDTGIGAFKILYPLQLNQPYERNVKLKYVLSVNIFDGVAVNLRTKITLLMNNNEITHRK